ncbi:hypothetical protein KUV62_08595 [Salipiger bermudensis]|nr:hypothetical protein [Salipiger bermudensis]
MGWTIFMHSVRMVLDNLGPALRVSAVLYLLQAASQILTFFMPQADPTAGDPTVAPVAAGELLILMVLALIASLWIAVGWHRFVLTGETPRGWLPAWHGSEILSYLGRSIVIGLLIGLGIAVIGGLAMGAAMAVPGLMGMVAFGLVGLASYVFFRIGLILPAAALGEKLSLGESWQATAKDDKAILVLALIVMAGQFLISVPAMIDGNSSSVISLVYSIVVNWFATMIGISVLTTLYGYFVEGRSLD